LYSYEKSGIEQADYYLRSLSSRFSWLAENPRLGKPRTDIKPGYYCFPEGMHLVFYKMTDNGIDIIGIPHQNMDTEHHFDV
jgi:toxin ParE1/3/4